MHPLLESLTGRQRDLLEELESLFLGINETVNLASRQTAADFERRHTLHSLALTKRSFPSGTTVVDWGTGGGLPGLPLAIAFPGVHFVLVDSTRKKTEAVHTMIRRLGLDNAEVQWGRAEAWNGRAHYAVSRATAPLSDLWGWTRRVLQPFTGELTGGDWAPGLIALKGGDLDEELARQRRKYPATTLTVEPLDALAGDAYFDEKVCVHVTPGRGE